MNKQKLSCLAGAVSLLLIVPALSEADRSLFDSIDNNAVVITSSPNSDVVSWAMINAKFDGATEIRLGNALQELALSDYRAFHSPILWPLPGYGYPVQKRVFAEIRGPKLAKSIIVLPVIHSTGDMVLDGSRFDLFSLAIPARMASQDRGGRIL